MQLLQDRPAAWKLKRTAIAHLKFSPHGFANVSLAMAEAISSKRTSPTAALQDKADALVQAREEETNGQIARACCDATFLVRLAELRLKRTKAMSIKWLE